MEKPIILENDEVFKHSVRLNTNRSYTTNVEQCAESIRETMFDLVKLGKLDATDLKIIDARDCSPMPSIREIARNLKMSHVAVIKRVTTIKRLFSANLP